MKSTPIDLAAHPITQTQADVVAFMNAFREREQCNPTPSEISAHFGWASPNAAWEHCKRLMRKGVLSFRTGRARGYIVNASWM